MSHHLEELIMRHLHKQYLQDYPLQFCANRWVENERVAMRAREIWPKIVEIIDFWKGLPKSKKPGKRKIGAKTPVMTIFVQFGRSH